MSPELKSRIAASTLTILLCCALASVVLIFTLSPFTQAKPTSETLIDTIKYQRLMSYRMQSVEDLEEWFIAERDSLLPVAPPSEDFILRQSFGSGVIPYDGEDFPAEFNRGLIAVYEYSVPIYPVTIGEDPITRNVVFLNAKNEIIYSLAPPKNYDPYEYAKYLYPLLEMGVYPDWWVEWQLALWDPARIQICTKLIATENLEHYLFAEKTVAELALSLPASGGGLLMMSGGGGGSNDLWLSINGPVQGVTNGIEVVAHIPEGFTNRLEIYSCTNLLDCWWTVEVTNLPSAGTNPVIWMNTNIGSVSRQCYVAGNADIDSDLDTLPNAREVLVHHTSATNADTDADGATDGQELQAGTDPLVNPGDADSDGLSDHLEIVLGTLTDSADTDLDWAGDGYEFEEGTDPLDPSDVPPLRVIVNAEQVYAPSTNLSISFPGLVAEDAQVSELPDFSNPETVSVTGQAVYALMHSTNGWRSLFARMRRPTNEISRTLSSVLILDTGSPVLTSITPTNNHVTARRWVRIEGTATDAVSSVRVLINGKWADGVSTGTFYDARFTLESGTNIVSVVALDRAGHSATQTLEVVQDASFDTTAPSIAFSMPCDYEIVGATTNWFQCTTFGADKSLYLRGEIDDETAFVFTMVESDGQTNGPYMGIVNGTQVWSIVSLFPGTNTLSLVAQDAAGNSSTATHTVVRNTNFFLRITDPLPYENMDSRSTLVYGVASTVFVDATIRVNDVQVNITDNTTNVTFVTSQCVPLNLGLTRIFGVAELEGQSFYVDPQVVGYEVLKDVGSYEIAINEISGEPDGEGYSEIQSENGDYQWTAQNGLAFSRWTNTTTECWWGDGWSTCETTENGSSGSWEKNSVGSLFGFGFASVVDEGKSSTREWREEDLYHYDERVTFKKHWPSQEVQNVIFQFGGLYSGYFVAGPPDPTELTYRGQTGFWYNGNAAFIVPIEMETEYILGASDFTWPITSKLILSDASGEWWENSHFLGFSSFTNHPLSVQMVPDYDHDGDIDDDDRAIQGSGQPFYFWENDDDDQTSDAKTGGDSDVPGVGSADSGNSQVDGTRDLIDFFPVF
ncbi:MAG: thrombospondin type 3 repeat-containing protein, partial [Verrucomicrobia bacterium]|nr:thrombospondin type 3 repeat-containing protein [Verrucomicrobiota bacterium]